MTEAKSFWAFLVVNEAGGEGVLGVPTKLGMTQAVSASEAVRDQLTNQMQQYADVMNTEVRLVRFDRAEVLETWEPHVRPA